MPADATPPLPRLAPPPPPRRVEWSRAGRVLRTLIDDPERAHPGGIIVFQPPAPEPASGMARSHPPTVTPG